MAVDRWLSRLPFGNDESDAAAAGIEPIVPTQAAAIRLAWSSKFTTARLTRHAASFPYFSWWNPQSGEYLIGEPWRHRDEIASIIEVASRRSRPALVERMVAEMSANNIDLLLLSEHEWYNNGRAYRDLGFSELERIIYFQLSGLESGPRTRRSLPDLQFVPLGWANLASAVEIDHAAFPWLWWNSEAEFAYYVGVPGVQSWLALSGGRPVAYTGFTTSGTWGHLDRIAVLPAAHGNLYGAATLAFALGIMRRQGVGRVTLSTQSDNFNAHRLYEGFGFVKTSNSQPIIGRWLRENAEDRGQRVEDREQNS